MIAEPLSAPGNEAVAKLRHERSILRQANRALWAKLAPAGRLPECLRLSDTEARLLASLLVNASLRKEALWYALYFDVPEPEMPLIKSVEIVACHLRARLKPHDIAISTPRCGDGYFMSLRDRAKVAGLIRAEADATGRAIGDFVPVNVAHTPSYVVPRTSAAALRAR